jgi:hypothetical protein
MPRLVEVLTFEGCPHAEPALELVRRVVAEAGVEAVVRRVDVPDVQSAEEQRFLGSPTIRVDGRDVEPGAEVREGYGLCCRVYWIEQAARGEPDERWLRHALAG